MPQPYVIGIDIGTGSTKGVALNRSGQVLAQAQVHYPTLDREPLFSEQDPELIWTAFAETIRNICAHLQAPPAAVSLSSCMHSLLLVDEEGAPITPSITWADRRSAAIAEALRSTPVGETLYKATGTPLHAMSPLCKIAWFQRHQPHLFKAATKFISVKEFIWHKLFRVYEVDYSIASATGLFDIRQLDWFPASLKFCGIRAGQLSTPVATQYMRTGMCATATALLNLPAETPFCIGASDGCLANVGSNALEAGTAAVTIGTSGAVRMANRNPIPVYPDMIFNYRLDEATYICGGAVNNGGNVVQWLLQQFLQRPALAAADYQALFELVATVPAGSEGLFCLPYLNGERAPLWDENACGVFFGIRPQHQQAHFVRAALEGGCFALYDVLKKLESAAGPIHTLYVSGGIVHAPVWMQLLADITGKNLCLAQTDDASAVGAALLCFNAMGLMESYKVEENRAQQTIVPDSANHAVYARAFTLFRNLYIALKATMHHLPEQSGSV
jgi:gluconokinase